VGISACINSEVYIWEGHRRQTEEPEAEMGESRDDSEPQDLAGIAKDLKNSIDNTQFSLQHHLQETQETMRRGQGELKEALERMTVSQEKIALLLMQMNHGRDGPNNNGNMEASGSQGGTRHHTETDHQLHTEGHSLFGGGPSRGPTNNRATPRPYMPTFLELNNMIITFRK
jgi:hypothetical protein